MSSKKTKTICAFCKKKISVQQKKDKNYCDTVCYNKHTKSKPIDGYKECINCGKSFPYRNSLKVRNMYSKVYKCYIARKDQKVCCFKCLISYRNREENPARGVEARRKISESAKKRGTAHLHTKEAQRKSGISIRGEKHWNWQGGKTPNSITDRHLIDNKDFRKAIKDRDGNKCTKCGSTKKLHAHHIKPWKDFPKLRWELSNGITLCASCHMKLEAKKRNERKHLTINL